MTALEFEQSEERVSGASCYIAASGRHYYELHGGLGSWRVFYSPGSDAFVKPRPIGPTHPSVTTAAEFANNHLLQLLKEENPPL